ncbi:MAG: alpha/beta hydrolase fold protein [Microbacteriaceae bacterium]|nr:alpha/beta hydrolase fold protein [Microbacteriaceae bacterium]
MTDLTYALPSGITLAYRIDGEGTPLLLIAGLGLDLVSWPPSLVDGLVAAGLQVIRFDNRDIGRSTKVRARPPSKGEQLRGRAPVGAYSLEDMAADTIGLLDHLGVDRVHLVGMSMGGMIAQVVASQQPNRVLSLTSIFSTTGNRRVGQPAASTKIRMARRSPQTEAEFIARQLWLYDHIGSRQYPYDPQRETDRARESWARAGGPHGAGIGRQIGAIFASGDRTTSLARISAPTLVIHGDRDLMVGSSGGAATAAAIPGARLVTIPGMRHHIAPGVVPQLLDLIVENTRSDA